MGLATTSVSDEEWYRRRDEDMRRAEAFFDETTAVTVTLRGTRSRHLRCGRSGGSFGSKDAGAIEHATNRLVIEHIAQQLGLIGQSENDA